jgi:hypothetical protein
VEKRKEAILGPADPRGNGLPHVQNCSRTIFDVMRTKYSSNCPGARRQIGRIVSRQTHVIRVRHIQHLGLCWFRPTGEGYEHQHRCRTLARQGLFSGPSRDFHNDLDNRAIEAHDSRAISASCPEVPNVEVWLANSSRVLRSCRFGSC